MHWVSASFLANDGIPLRGWYRPTSNSAAIVLAHGWGESRTELLKEAESLSASGFGVLLFDLRAHGESGGSISTMGERERADVLAAVEFVAKQEGVDERRIGAVGFSIGAAAVVRAAAVDGRLRAMVLLSPVDDFESDMRFDFQDSGWLGQWLALRTFAKAGVDVAGFKPIEDLRRTRARRVMLVYGEREPQPDMVERMSQAAPAGSELWIVPDAGHGDFLRAAGDAYLERLRRFLERALATPE
ncbi:MAG: alpha/beta hydrolase [Myxococcaceae bacterium]